ncbi:MAG: hypothetical protein ACFFBD_16710 [Candidatus Hodarchaeota archaeon]
MKKDSLTALNQLTTQPAQSNNTDWTEKTLEICLMPILFITGLSLFLFVFGSFLPPLLPFEGQGSPTNHVIAFGLLLLSLVLIPIWAFFYYLLKKNLN